MANRFPKEREEKMALADIFLPESLHHSGSEYEESYSLQDALNAEFRDSLRSIALGVGILYVVLAIAHVILQPSSVARPMTAVAGGTAVILFVLYYALGQRQLPRRWAHPVGAFIAGLALFNSLLHIYLSADPQQTTNLLFVLIGVGLFFFSPRWLVLVMMATAAGWGAIVAVLPPSPDWIHFGVALFMGAFLSVLAFVVRRRAFQRHQHFRVQDEQRRRELQRRAGQLEMSIDVGQHITSILDLDVLLNRVVELIEEHYDCYYVGVFLMEENGRYVRAQAGTGEAGQKLCHKAFRLKVGEEGLIGWVAAHNRPVRVDDVSRDPRYVSVDDVPHVRSELDLPLRVGDKILGVLDMQSKRLAAFSEEDVPFMQLLADQVAIAIYNAFLYRGEKSARRLAETLLQTGQALNSTLNWSEVLDLILEHLAEIVSYDRVAVMVPERTELVVVASRGFPPEMDKFSIPIDHEDEKIFRDIYRTKRPLSIPDVAGRPDWQQLEDLPLARAWLGVPLIRSDEVVGMLSLTRETTDAFTGEEIELANAFAGQAAIALGNARLYDKMARFNQQLEYEVRQRTAAVQEAYEQLERLDRAKSDFISIASHELRTPLTIVRGYSQMLLKDDTIRENDRHQRLLTGIQAGAIRLGEIVNSMLDMAKIDNRALQLYPEPVSIPALLELLFEEFENDVKQRSLTLEIEEMPDLPAIEADLEALQKVFYHLIINAIKYTPDGGLITISGGELVNGGLDLPAEGIEIVVSDTGIGIDPDVQELIFTKFYQTGEVALHSTGKTTYKGGGPGLGLAIARGIVEAHRGRLWVESAGHDEEKLPGSKFHVALPLRQR